MRDQAPRQLFDGSFFDALVTAHTATEALYLAPEETPCLTSPAVDWESYDWEAYGANFYQQLPEDWKASEESVEFARRAGLRILLARTLNTEMLSFLLRSTAPQAVWTFLKKDDHKELLHNATRGFQRTPGILRQNVVRARIIKWLEQNPTEKFLLLSLWIEEPAAREALETIGAATDLSGKTKIPGLVGKCGLETMLAAYAWLPAPRLYGALYHLSEDREALQELVESSRGEDALAEEAPCSAPQQPIMSVEEQVVHWKNLADQQEIQATENRVALEALLTRAESLQSKADQAHRDHQKSLEREKLQAAHWEKKHQNLELREKREKDRLIHDLDRTSRKFKSLEKEKTELETETRRLKKQLRQAQVLLEELRKRPTVLAGKPEALAGPVAPPNTDAGPGSAVEAVSTPESTPATKTRPVVVSPPTPQDELFEWKADGRLVRLTARAVKRLVDANDEDAVYTIMQALDSLNDGDKELRDRFLKRLAQAGGYYVSVLTRSTLRVLVDASNVARFAPNRYGKGQLQFLHGMREELRRRECFPIVFYADASLPYFIDDPKEFRAMVLRGEIIMADKGTEADELLAREARRTGAYVVTNDRLFFNKVSPDFEPPRITFRIYDGTVIVDEF